MAHTPTPWVANGHRVESEKDHGWANDGWIVAHCEGPGAEDNAVLIAHRANVHDVMLAALEAFVKGSDELSDVNLQQVIDRAKNKAFIAEAQCILAVRAAIKLAKEG